MKNNRLLALQLAAASLSLVGSAPFNLLKGSNKGEGIDISSCVEPDKEFTDSNGRRYIKDSKGVIRRVKI